MRACLNMHVPPGPRHHSGVQMGRLYRTRPCASPHESLLCPRSHAKLFLRRARCLFAVVAVPLAVALSAIETAAGSVRFPAAFSRPFALLSRWQLQQVHVRRSVGRGSLSDGAALYSVAGPGDEEDDIWLPPLDTSVEDSEPSNDTGVTVLPLFPLGGIDAYVPHSYHELNIFEPRYRKLYNDILISGSRRFVVSAVHPNGNQFAEVGVVFYLEDLREVSEQTMDEVKYVCNHRVIGRVRIQRVLNPARWEDESTYLRVQTIPVEDISEDCEDLAQQEAEVMAELQQVALLQKELGVAQITSDVARHVNASRSENGGLWSLVALWSEYYEYLATEREHHLEEDMRRIYKASVDVQWEEGDGDNDDEDEVEDEVEDMLDTFDMIYIDELPQDVQASMHRLQEQFQEDMDALLSEQTRFLQALLRSSSHHERLVLMTAAFHAERRRLSAKQAVLAALRDPEGSSGSK
mmetsp:Transcript_99776/g.311676  ORF Transcript_99776/g.311676 Transcript_99776/m.311676 type:complete len:465 (+) Transcript_99776:13-1407(+)